MTSRFLTYSFVLRANDFRWSVRNRNCLTSQFYLESAVKSSELNIRLMSEMHVIKLLIEQESFGHIVIYSWVSYAVVILINAAQW